MGPAKAKGCIEALPAGGGGLKGVCGEIQGLAVVGLEHEQAQGHRRDAALQQGPDRGEVAEGFAHLLAPHIDHAVVQPDPGQVRTGGRFRLGDLVFMVGKHQVGTPEVDVDRVAEFFAHHR